MTMTVRAAADRGQADFGWLRSAHSFSFGSYHDPKHVQFGVLRVINDDVVANGGGFPQHAHENAEIFSYVLEGALEHKDSLGNESIVTQGGVQYMSAGGGVTHSEFNPSATQQTRFLQIWLLPDRTGGTPRYQTLDIAPAQKQGSLKLFLSHDGRDGSIQTLANANVYAAMLCDDETIEHDLGTISKAWLQVAGGSVLLNGKRIHTGDGVAIEGGGKIEIGKGNNAEVLLFEMP